MYVRFVVNNRDFELATSQNSVFVRFKLNKRDFEASNVEKFNVC